MIDTLYNKHQHYFVLSETGKRKLNKEISSVKVKTHRDPHNRIEDVNCAHRTTFSQENPICFPLAECECEHD